jgi:hypothetical protein
MYLEESSRENKRKQRALETRTFRLAYLVLYLDDNLTTARIHIPTMYPTSSRLEH